MNDLATVALLGFAAARVTQLVIWDSILDGARQRLAAWHMDGVQPGRANRLRTFIRDLFACIYCFGFHASWLTVLAFTLATGGNPVASVGAFFQFGIWSFAVAGVQMLVNRWDDSLDRD